MAKQLNLYRGRVKSDPEREARQNFYKSRQWQKVRRLVLAERPVCECGEIDEATGKTCERAANEVHHVIDLSERPDLAYALDNLKSYQKACHSRETARRQSRSF